MEGKELPVYGDGKNIRDWLYVVDRCSAILAVLHKGRIGETYNIGANGMLAQMVKMVAPVEYAVTSLVRPDFDITDRNNVLSTLQSIQPDVIVNCAAYTYVDGCETNGDLAFTVNGEGPGYLAEAALELDATLVHISTDYVFPGDKKEPYREGDPTGPVSAYGRSKLAGEQAIATSGLTKYFILRTSWLYGPGGNNFVETILRLAREREQLRIVADQHGSPTYTGDLAKAIFSLLASAQERPTYGLELLGVRSQHSTSDGMNIGDHSQIEMQV